MYARVARFEGEPTTVDGLVDALREHAGASPDVPGARRSLFLADRESGARLGIALFESSEAMRAAEQTFEAGDEIPEELRGRRTSVQVYEVALEQVGEGSRAATVIALEGSPEGLEDGILGLNEYVLPDARDLTGWRGLLVLADRGTGSTRVVLLWDALESLVASDEAGGELRRRIASALGESVTGVERFEVALHEAPVSAA